LVPVPLALWSAMPSFVLHFAWPFGAGENVWLLDSQEHMEENLNIFDFELSQDP